MSTPFVDGQTNGFGDQFTEIRKIAQMRKGLLSDKRFGVFNNHVADMFLHLSPHQRNLLKKSRFSQTLYEPFDKCLQGSLEVPGLIQSPEQKQNRKRCLEDAIFGICENELRLLTRCAQKFGTNQTKCVPQKSQLIACFLKPPILLKDALYYDNV